MQRFKKFMGAIYEDFRLPWQLVVGLAILSSIGAAVISAVAIGLMWLLFAVIGKPFVFNEALLPGLFALVVVFFVVVIVDYIRQTWKDTNDKS